MDPSQLLKGVLDLAVLAVLRDADGYGYDVLRRLRAAGLRGCRGRFGVRDVAAAVRGRRADVVRAAERGRPASQVLRAEQDRPRSARPSPPRRGTTSPTRCRCLLLDGGGGVNSTLTGAVATYLTQVRAELSDLPPGELADVLEDVSGHLTEVGARVRGASRPSRPCRSASALRGSTPTSSVPRPATRRGPSRSPKPETRAEPGVALGRRRRPSSARSSCGRGPRRRRRARAAFFGFIGRDRAVRRGVPRCAGTAAATIRESSRHTPRGSAPRSIRGMIEQIPPNVRQRARHASASRSGGSPRLRRRRRVLRAVRRRCGRRGRRDRRGRGVDLGRPPEPAGPPLALVRRTAERGRRDPRTGLAVLRPSSARTAASSIAATRTRAATTRRPNGLRWNGNEVTNLYPFDDQGKQVSVRAVHAGRRGDQPPAAGLRTDEELDGPVQQDSSRTRSPPYPPEESTSSEGDPTADPTGPPCQDEREGTVHPAAVPDHHPVADAVADPTQRSPPSPSGKRRPGQPGATLTVTPTR